LTKLKRLCHKHGKERILLKGIQKIMSVREIKKILKNIMPDCLLYGYYKHRRRHHLLPNERLNFDVTLSEHCNLNCAGCNHFSPLAEAEFIDPAALAADFARLAELFKDRVSLVNLMGGEPLLHPHLTDCLRITRRHFPQSALCLVTNGILLSGQKEDFWQACRENHISISVSRYPIKLDFAQISAIAKENSVELYLSGQTAQEAKSFYRVPLDLSGKQDKDISFVMCNRANACIALNKGRLFTCQAAANIEHFNKFFQQTLTLSPDDYIDIYKAQSAEEILNFLAKPIPFCRFCNLKSKIDNLVWHTSEKNIAEWT
jgi:organic radical activating enzyme